MAWWYGHPWAWPWYGGAIPYATPWGPAPYWAPWGGIPKEQEIAMLEDQARALERDLDSIRKRLEELKK